MNATKPLAISSIFLQRDVLFDIYGIEQLKPHNQADLLLINDGQDLVKMNFSSLLERFHRANHSLIVVGLHAGVERKQEYGVAGMPDYMNRGAKASLYASFVMQEMIPMLRQTFNAFEIHNKYIAGFSLGGLMAFDLALEFPMEFSAVGVFSGSFWWRSKDLNDNYMEDRDRIMHAKIRNKTPNEFQRFFLQAGALDEKEDRNNNGIIDSIDDTLDIIKELEQIGFQRETQIKYLELEDGKHDTATWKKAMPLFLEWLLMK